MVGVASPRESWMRMGLEIGKGEKRGEIRDNMHGRERNQTMGTRERTPVAVSLLRLDGRRKRAGARDANQTGRDRAQLPPPIITRLACMTPCDQRECRRNDGPNAKNAALLSP